MKIMQCVLMIASGYVALCAPNKGQAPIVKDKNNVNVCING